MKRSLAAISAIAAGVLLASVALAGDDVTSLSYISYLERYATIRPAHGEADLDVVVNMPVLAGDRLDTSRGARVEAQLADGSTLWLDEFTTVDFDSIALSRDDSASRTALYLAEGTVAIEVPATAAGDGALRFDSPAGAVFLNRPGLYRLELRGNEIQVQAHTGFVELPAGIGSEILRGGEEATVGAQSEVRRAAISDTSDDFWAWVQERRHAPSGPSSQYLDARAAGRAAVLDSYGDWVYVPTFSSWMWQPHVSVGWVPYSYGRWYWTPVGWSWISYEPWGWYPFHYGSWYFDAGFGWVWGWDSVWGPAWVDWFYTPGYVGWCPRGYYDWWCYHNWNGPGGGKFLRPHRWNEASLDFAGRVRLGQIDPKPWTIVPSNHFSSPHVDRVRLDAQRFLREGQSDREGLVRSGPLVTPFPNRTSPEQTVDAFFHGGRVTESLPDMSAVMRREVPTGARSATQLPDLRIVRTSEVVTATRTESARVLNPESGTSGAGRWTVRERTSGQAVTGLPGATTGTRVLRSGGNGSQGSNPPVIRREVIHRTESSHSTGSTGSSSSSQGTSSHSSGGSKGGSTVERPAPSRPNRPPSGSVSWNRSSGTGSSTRELVQSRDRWATSSLRRDSATVRSVGTFSSAPTVGSREVVSSRTYRATSLADRVTVSPGAAPRALSSASRSYPSVASRGTLGGVRSFASGGSTSHASSHSVSVSHTSSRSSGASKGGRRP